MALYCMTVTGKLLKKEIKAGIKNRDFQLTRHTTNAQTETIFRLANHLSWKAAPYSPLGRLERTTKWHKEPLYTGIITKKRDVLFALLLTLRGFSDSKWAKSNNKSHKIINQFTVTEGNIREAAKLEHRYLIQKELCAARFRFLGKCKNFNQQYLDNMTLLKIEEYYADGLTKALNEAADLIRRIENIAREIEHI